MSYLSYDILRVEAITRDNHIDYVIQPAQAPAHQGIGDSLTMY